MMHYRIGAADMARSVELKPAYSWACVTPQLLGLTVSIGRASLVSSTSIAAPPESSGGRRTCVPPLHLMGKLRAVPKVHPRYNAGNTEGSGGRVLIEAAKEHWKVYAWMTKPLRFDPNSEDVQHFRFRNFATMLLAETKEVRAWIMCCKSFRSSSLKIEQSASLCRMGGMLTAFRSRWVIKR